MQLSHDLWIEGSYYIDFDRHGQLRIVGPNNHLHYGSVGLYRQDLVLDKMYTEKGQLVAYGRILHSKLFLHDPVVAHIQKVRHYIERPGRPVPTFAAVFRRHASDLSPNYIGLERPKDGYEIAYKRLYQRHWYGVSLQFDPAVEVRRSERRRGFNIESKSQPEIQFKLTTLTDLLPASGLETVVVPEAIDTTPLGDQKPEVDRLLDRTAIEVTHLIKNDKTSGFDYGTVFPRDWMESADIGSADLEPAAIRYMYHKAFEFVDPQGVGWHENIVGEFEFEKRQEVGQLDTSLDDLIDRSSRIGAALRDLIAQVEDMYVIRNMVDIEPRYLMGLADRRLASLQGEDLERVRRVARYITLQAQIHDLITFKKMPALLRRHKHDEYYAAGNWRDSMRAFKMVHPVIAPYDVNVVFYPLALNIIRQHADLLQADEKLLDSLVEKWRRPREWYRFDNPDGTSAFALALYDIKRSGEQLEYKKLAINHIDEAYAAFYAKPDEADVVSFCKRLLSRDYFYTASGPALVGAGDGYDTTQYHGRVIWTKQTAYVVAGLYRQLELAEAAKWRSSTIQLLRRTIIETCQTSLQAFFELGAIPELHYDLKGEPHFYNDQPNAEGPMNEVQLWSALGARRIIRTYLKVLSHAKRPTRARSK